MKSKIIFSEQTTIKISVVKIEDKKLTKGIVSQLNIESPFDRLYNLKADVKIFGYVYDKFKWIIWCNKEKLYKYELNNFYPLLRLELNKDKIDALIKIYPSDIVKNLFTNDNYSDMEITRVLDTKEQYQIIEKKEMISEFIKEILIRQIFI